MLTSTRKQRLAAVALLLTVGLAGCAKKNDPTVATGGSGGPKTGASSAATGDNSDLKFSQCMRDQGLTWFPDPDPNGGLKVSIPTGTDQSTVDKAQEACKQYAQECQKYMPPRRSGGNS
jgi:hypothetical protein